MCWLAVNCGHVCVLMCFLNIIQNISTPGTCSYDFIMWFSCVLSDVDECETNSHHCNPTQVCINTAGGYTCSCTEGFWLIGSQCQGELLFIECSTGQSWHGTPNICASGLNSHWSVVSGCLPALYWSVIVDESSPSQINKQKNKVFIFK